MLTGFKITDIYGLLTPDMLVQIVQEKGEFSYAKLVRMGWVSPCFEELFKSRREEFNWMCADIMDKLEKRWMSEKEQSGVRRAHLLAARKLLVKPVIKFRRLVLAFAISMAASPANYDVIQQVVVEYRERMGNNATTAKES